MICSPPLPRRLNTPDTTQRLGRKLQRDIGKALHLAGGARPGPRGVPGDGAATQRVHACALLAGGVVALAPEVVVDDVAAGGGGSPLVAEVGTAGEAFGWEGGCVGEAGEA